MFIGRRMIIKPKMMTLLFLILPPAGGEVCLPTAGREGASNYK
jgi:hypothetical protein